MVASPQHNTRRGRTLGQRGEQLAAAYLERVGMRVLARNWQCHAGEIDILARHGGRLVVVEVKTRSSLRFGTPLEAVTPEKRRRLRHLSWLAAARYGAAAGRTRVDAVSVLTGPGGRVFLRHHRRVA
ncbi:putative endonuclease [Haloactinospora alba]|uniref:UPF0102 protein FHX37_0599 n=1 Tax=Haloactinospora alba TaxID=405555 RepID=A0A543NFV1_9ACTN|nr:YraN family protein [Haloactinospora alba]TQN30717.1 putative endonuclease [Haloactinospora alba]